MPIDWLPPMHTACGSLLLGQPHWVWGVVAVIAAIVAVLSVLYRQSGWPTRLSWLAGGLKGLAVAMVAVCLLEPLWSGARARPGDNLVLLAADTSASLTIADGPGGRARSEPFQQALENSQADWQVRLGQDFRVRRYSVSAAPSAVTNFEQLEFSSEHSNLGSSLRSIRNRYAHHPVAAVVLFTDGLATDELDPTAAEWKSGPPVYPVLPETEGELRDVAIEQIAVTQSSFEDAPVTIQADVRTTPNFAERLVVRVVDAAGQPVEEQTQSPVSGSRATPFRFQLRPDSALAFYTVQARIESDGEAWSDPPKSSEATLANNVRSVAVERDPGPYRVLYVAGRPNWEFKFLRRAVAEDPDIQLVGLIRMARKEAKFEFLGRDGESSNPLFRGFRKEGDEETESYDEAVLIALGVKDGRELTDAVGGTTKSRFPRTVEELFQYQAIILDDVEAEFFTHVQQAQLEQFVAQRGGGLLMLGGPGSFHHGGWHKSVVKDVLPVYCDRTPTPLEALPLADPPQQFHMQLTRDGWLQPWVRLRTTEVEEQSRLQSMSGFQVLSQVNGVKPAAQVLASVLDADGQPRPALVAQSYGDGRGAALLIGDLWRWSLKREPGTEDDLSKAWRQAVRWLVADVPQRIEPALHWTTAGESESIALRVRVRDKAFEPQENAAAMVVIEMPDATTLTLPCEPSLEEPGLFEAMYVPRASGGYRARFDVTDANGAPLGTAQLGWVHEPQADEFRSIRVDRERMRQLAAATGGEVVPLDQLLPFVESLPERDVPIKEVATTPLWHSPWTLAAILLLLAGEWGLRRWKGLP
ncbi:MAG: hypothetical protein ACK5Q5_20430 [Planctomycetaceae bacterium]